MEKRTIISEKLIDDEMVRYNFSDGCWGDVLKFMYDNSKYPYCASIYSPNGKRKHIPCFSYEDGLNILLTTNI
jgi:hypothetical protein